MLKVVASYDSSLHPVTARDGAEALEVLLNPLRLPRLVLMDLALPKLAGTEVLREPRTPETFLSSYSAARKCPGTWKRAIEAALILG